MPQILRNDRKRGRMKMNHPRYLITGKVQKKLPRPEINTLWKLLFSSFRNAMFQNLVDLAFWEKQIWPFFI